MYIIFIIGFQYLLECFFYHHHSLPGVVFVLLFRSLNKPPLRLPVDINPHLPLVQIGVCVSPLAFPFEFGTSLIAVDTGPFSHVSWSVGTYSNNNINFSMVGDVK